MKHQPRLVNTSVAPVYLALELRGDRFDSNAIHHYLPERHADGAFEVPARPGLDKTTIFIDLGRVIPGTLEIETDAAAGMSFLERRDGWTLYAVGSGHYRFTFTLSFSEATKRETRP